MPKKNEFAEQGHAWAMLITTNAILLERMETALKDADLPNMASYDVLWTLEKAEKDRLRMHELAQHVLLTRSNLTRLADRLEEAKFIRREDCPGDRRGNFCVLTDEGRKMRQKMWLVYKVQIDELFSKYLTASEAEAMSNALKKVLHGVEAG
jgi:DNA-binding MarR family transcriptional regulator